MDAQVTSTTPELKIQKPLADWTVQDVCNWLGEIGLPRYQKVFHDNQIDGLELMQLSPATMQKNLNISEYQYICHSRVYTYALTIHIQVPCICIVSGNRFLHFTTWHFGYSEALY